MFVLTGDEFWRTEIHRGREANKKKTPAEMAEELLGDSVPDLEVFTLVQMQALADEMERNLRHIVEGWVPAGEVVLLAGRSKAGKSTAIADLIASCITGSPWLGLLDTVESPVIYFNYENSPLYLMRNINVMLNKRGYSLGECSEMVRFANREQLRAAGDYFDPDVAIKAIRRMQDATEMETGLLVVDCARPAFHQMFPDKADWENSPSHVSRVFDALREVTSATGWGVNLIHHSPKSGSGPIGSSAWSGEADYIINFDIKTHYRTMESEGRHFETPDEVVIRKMGPGDIVGEYKRSSTREEDVECCDDTGSPQGTQDVDVDESIRESVKSTLGDSELSQGVLVDEVQEDLRLSDVSVGQKKIVKVIQSMPELMSTPGAKKSKIWSIAKG